MKAHDAAPTPALDWLFGLQRFGVKPGLGPMRALLAALGAPAERYSSVLVAGTNGKGSVAHTLAAALVAPDRTVGLYTSPHLQRVGERVVVDGRETDADRLEATVAALRPAAERLGNTFFEVMTAAALVSFADAAVDVAVLEVGLGGRLDATNVVTPVLSVITSVGLDHTAVLGDDLAQIAFEKAGIMRPGVPVVSGVTEPAAATVVAARAAGLGAPLLEYGAGFWGEVSGIGWDGSEFVWRHPGATQDGAWVRTPSSVCIRWPTWPWRSRRPWRSAWSPAAPWRPWPPPVGPGGWRASGARGGAWCWTALTTRPARGRWRAPSRN